MLLGGHVTEHGRAVHADHRGPDGRGDVVVARGDVGGERAQCVERRLVAHLALQVTFSAIRCSGTWPGPSIITWTSWRHATSVSSPKVRSSANCAWSLASAIDPGRNPSPSENATS